MLTLLRDGRTRPEEWDRRERSAVTRLHAWAFRHGSHPWPALVTGPAVARVRVEEDAQGLRLTGTLANPDEPEHRCPTCGVRLAEPIGYPHAPSDGYLDDAEQWGEDRQTLVDYARNSGHGVLQTREVLALLRLDRILGNEGALSPTGTGRVRGVVSGALRDWHARQRAVVDSIGLGPADPDGGPFPVGLPHGDPAEVPSGGPTPHLDLGEAGGNGEPLDAQIARLAGWIVENVEGEPSRSEGAIDCALRLLQQWQQLLADAAREADRADAAEQRLASMTGRRDRARDHAVRNDGERDTYRAEVEEQTARAEREHAARLRAESLLAAQQETTVVLRGHLDDERRQREELSATVDLYRHRYGSRLEWNAEQLDAPADERAPEPVELYVPTEARVSWDGRVLRALYLRPYHGEVGSEQYPDGKGRPLTMEDVRAEGLTPTAEPTSIGEARVRVVPDPPHEPIDLRPLEEDPRRPHLDSWPDDAVLLRYAELRRLVSLHLERYADTRTARAMLEGDVPLRLSEVLDR